MNASMNGGWEDSPEDEREEMDAFESDDEQWRGAAHPDTWPEYLAGGEYWLYKKNRDEGL